MKISEIFNLGKTQFELNFVDIDIERDTQLFIDPYFLSTRPDPWSISASRTLTSFFEQFITLIRNGREDCSLYDSITYRPMLNIIVIFI